MTSLVEKRVWGIHSLDNTLFLVNKIVALGWREMGDLTAINADRGSFKKKYKATYPSEKDKKISISTGMLFRFCYEAQEGDYVVFPSKNDRMIHIGVIKGPYIYDSAQPRFVQTRRVEWLKHLPRTSFSQGALYEVGSAMSFFAIKNYADEFLAALEPGFKKWKPDPDDTVAAAADSIIESTKDFILKELKRQLKGYDLEFFVADLLQAMGYRTTISKRGGDSGIDITAYKDELPPRILVQVKSEDANIKEATIQSLKGAMREGDYGLFVTLSDYTKNAATYLDNTPIIRGINGAELADLILKYYGQLSDKFRRMIPLKTVYIPVAEETEDGV